MAMRLPYEAEQFVGGQQSGTMLTGWLGGFGAVKK
jgi:hypothetical protein